MSGAAMGRGLVVNAAAAALIDHHLRGRGQDISMLGQAVLRIVDRHGLRINRSGDYHLPFTNDIHVAARTTDIQQVSFTLDDGEPLHMPPLIGSVKEDDDKDLVMTLREMMMAPGVVFNTIDGNTRIVTSDRLPETLVIAARGLPLAEVVSHPALDGKGLRAARIENMPEGNTFNIRGNPAMGTAITLSPAGKVILRLDQGGPTGE